MKIIYEGVIGTLSDKESTDMRIEKSDGNQHSKNKMAFPELLHVFC